MQDVDTINILVAQLLAKDDEILHLRVKLDQFQKEQQQGNTQVLDKLDKA